MNKPFKKYFISRDLSLKAELDGSGIVFIPADYVSIHTKVAMLPRLASLIQAAETIYLDFETTSTDSYCGEIVLTSIMFERGGEWELFTIDNFTVKIDEILSTEILKNTQIVAHNLMFETLWLLKYNIHIKRAYCTMIAEQKLLQGADVRFNIVDTLSRRGLPVPPDMIKDIRKDFGPLYIKHELKHITYNQADVVCLPDLKEAQESLITAQGIQFLLYGIHFPLIRTLALSQREGMIIDEPKFTALAEVAEQKMSDLEAMMTAWLKTEFPGIDLIKANQPLVKEIARLEKRKQTLTDRAVKHERLILKYLAEKKTHLKAYQLSQKMFLKAQKEYNDTCVDLAHINSTGSISWSSSAQVICLLESLGCRPMPLIKNKKTKQFQPSLGKAPRERWLLQNRNHKLYDLMKSFDSYMKLTKHVNSFGKSFLIKYKHPVTGRFHTAYKQGTVATGRLASGDAKGIPPKFNSQQIPGLKELRECFRTAVGYLIGTFDLSGAELITMCSLANDQDLLKISKSDMHSYFANKGWKAIYRDRGLVWLNCDEISSTNHPEKRKQYKPMLFGTVYGLMAPKAAETLNVSEREGGIALDTIVAEIPATIRMVKQAIQQALQNGYVIHNNRTYSRRWFSPVFTAKRERRGLTFVEKREVEGGARNTRIQGTQADMLCEAMVLLQRYIDLYKLDAVILLQVHDEIVVKFKEEYKDWFPKVIQSAMTRTANKYLLPGIEMECTGHVLETWTK